ncbi:MAG: glutamine synthetase [Actinomyces sp.]|nr:MAG: glutamine synthetase [Actinomyces sp.]
MRPDELVAEVAAGGIDTVVVAFTDLYGRLLGKRFDARFFVDEVLDAGTHACDYLLTVDMEMEPVPGYRFANWESGYGDVHLVVDPDTLRRAGWAERTAVVLCDVVDAGHEPVPVAPRTMLARQVDRAAAGGWRAMAASELEFFCYVDSYRQAHEKGYADLVPAGWYIEDYHLLQGRRVEDYVGAARRALSASGIPVESSKGEWGRGQHELNIRYADVATMADRHTVMKHGMKELADALGVSVTFMAKPHTDEAGSSCHIHLSLWDAEAGTNVFDGPGGRSELFGWFLGGWMAHVADFMVFYAPTVNSYKRYRDASWAPTRIAWSTDNRTAGFRVVGSGPSLRIECRLPGADCNPYLAYTAALASGLAGIEKHIDPPAEFVGDVYAAAEVPRVPATLDEALARFAASEVARDALGAEVVEHYAHFFAVEAEAFHTAVTDWERRRYFERI